MTSAPPEPRPARPRIRTVSRRTRTLSVVVGGREGPRSRLWTVTAPRTGALDVVVTGEDPAPPRTEVRAGRWIELPATRSGGVPAPALGAAVQSPAPGWHVGAVLVVQLRALCAPAHTPVPDGTRRVVAPPPGHHVQIVLLLGDDGCAPLDLPREQDGGSLLLPGGQRVQLWSHHVPNGPWSARRAAGSPGDGTVDGVPVVVDPGQATGAEAVTDRT